MKEEIQIPWRKIAYKHLYFFPSLSLYSSAITSSLIPTVIVSAFNFIMPIIFESLAHMEQWRTELFVIQLTVVRRVEV